VEIEARRYASRLYAGFSAQDTICKCAANALFVMVPQRSRWFKSDGQAGTDDWEQSLGAAMFRILQLQILASILMEYYRHPVPLSKVSLSPTSLLA
jgi:hypothetical protein